MTSPRRVNYYAGVALNWSALFLLVMAVLVYSPMLFYMATTVMITIAAARLQAWLAVRYLRFERFSAPAVRVGEPVTVEIVVWSERQLKRPLVTVEDHLPSRLVVKDRTPALPVAPSFDQPIRTRYSFTPMRRGRYRWERLTATSNDALGLVTMSQSYHTEPAELVVYPSPLPFNEEIRPLMGWGASDLDSGRTQGSGLDPRGVREFAVGDPIRYIHWRSSAKRDKIMVKEFETGSGVTMHLVLQRTDGTEVGDQETSTFESMCSHALTLATEYSKRGASVSFPVHEPLEAAREHPEARTRAVRELLTDVMPDARSTISQDLYGLRGLVREGETVVVFVSDPDPALPDTLSGWADVQFVCVVYDPNDYSPVRQTPRGRPIEPPEPIRSAASPTYIASLERAGARVIPMPRREAVHTS